MLPSASELLTILHLKWKSYASDFLTDFSAAGYQSAIGHQSINVTSGCFMAVL